MAIDFTPDPPKAAKSAIGFSADPAQEASPGLSDAQKVALLTSLGDPRHVAHPSGMGFELGALGGLHNAISNALSAIPGIHIHPAFTGTSGAEEAGKAAANIGAFMGGGEALKSAPVIGGGLADLGASKLGKALGGILGGSAYGYLESPQDRIKGAGVGGTLSGVLSGAGEVGKGISTLAKGISPTSVGKGLLNSLSDGKSLSDNRSALGSALKSAYNKAKSEGKFLYDNIFGSDVIPGGSAASKMNTDKSQYVAESADNLSSFGPNARKMNDKFLRNPTLDNAHKLQSQLGANIGSLNNTESKSGLDAASQDVRENLVNSRESLINDIGNHLDTIKPGLKDKYSSATENWLNNVVPFTSNPVLSKVVKGKITNPSSSQVTKIFSNPEPDFQDVLDKYSPEIKDKVAFNTLGQMKNRTSPESLVKSYESLSQKGMDPYISPELSKGIEDVKGRIKLKNAAQLGAGAILGGALAHTGSADVTPDILGMALGGYLGKGIATRLQGILPEEGIQKASSALYPHLTRALISNIAQGQR